MDSSETIKLFDSDNTDVVLPTISSEATDNSKSLISESIDRKILGEKVITLDIPEDSEIAKNNFIFDFTNFGQINVMQKNSLKALVSRDGTVQLYLYIKGKGLMAFGMGEKYTLEKMIPLIKFHVFDNEIKVYKDFKIGCKPVEVENRDITKMRLNL